MDGMMSCLEYLGYSSGYKGVRSPFWFGSYEFSIFMRNDVYLFFEKKDLSNF